MNSMFDISNDFFASSILFLLTSIPIAFFTPNSFMKGESLQIEDKKQIKIDTKVGNIIETAIPDKIKEE